MPRGVVLAFPSPQGLTRDDLEGLQSFAVISLGARIDILSSRKRRTVAILALAGRQLWIERDEATLRACEVSNRRQLATGADVSRLLAAVQAALLPGGQTVWGRATGAGLTEGHATPRGDRIKRLRQVAGQTGPSCP